MTVLIGQFQLGVEAARQFALFEPRYNIAPTQDVLVVRVQPKQGEREAVMLRWGLVPSWSKELQSGPPMINARGETIAEKPSFRTAVRKRRCLIPADGFYEWQKEGGATAKSAKKQPFLIHYRDNRPFAFAGLWESWTGNVPTKDSAAKVADGDGGLTIESCTIVTTSASPALQSLYDRMPVILEPSDFALWLDPKVQDPAAVQPLVVPNDDPEIIFEPVSTHVNKVANDDARCVQVQRALFD
jgi:putative SOS response-associated peptidase YedK